MRSDRATGPPSSKPAWRCDAWSVEPIAKNQRRASSWQSSASCSGRDQQQTGAWFNATEGNGGLLFGNVVADGAVSRFWVTSFAYDLYGVWIATLEWGRPAGEPDVSWLRDLAVATAVTVESPAFEIVLSPAVGDPEARAAFVEACMAM